jgi:hypothetical protein
MKLIASISRYTQYAIKLIQNIVKYILTKLNKNRKVKNRDIRLYEKRGNKNREYSGAFIWSKF